MTRRSWALFAAMCVIWGIPYLLIRVAVRDVEPGTLVFLRTAIGGLVLLPLALTRGGFGPVLRRWAPLLAFTVLEVAVPWLLLSDAEQHLSSSLTGLLIAAVPLRRRGRRAAVTAPTSGPTRLQLVGLLRRPGRRRDARRPRLRRHQRRRAARGAGRRDRLRGRAGDHGAAARRPAEHPGRVRVAAAGRARLPARTRSLRPPTHVHAERLVVDRGARAGVHRGGVRRVLRADRARSARPARS